MSPTFRGNRFRDVKAEGHATVQPLDPTGLDGSSNVFGNDIKNINVKVLNAELPNSPTDNGIRFGMLSKSSVHVETSLPDITPPINATSYFVNKDQHKATTFQLTRTNAGDIFSSNIKHQAIVNPD